MAWSAAVTAASVVGGIVSVTVEYTNGVATPFSENYADKFPSPTWIQDRVRDRIAQLTAATANVPPVGPVTPSAPVVPNAELELFRRRFALLVQVQALVALGVVAPDHPRLVALKTWIANKLPTHFDAMAG